jgi:hypothetical protein
MACLVAARRMRARSAAKETSQSWVSCMCYFSLHAITYCVLLHELLGIGFCGSLQLKSNWLACIKLQSMWWANLLH